MDRPATTRNETTDVDLLVETDSKVLDMVRKDLSQEYLRLVTRAMQEKSSRQIGWQCIAGCDTDYGQANDLRQPVAAMSSRSF